VIENIIDDNRSKNAFGLMMSLNMLIETPEGYDFSAVDFDDWAKETGFSKTLVIPLAGPSSAVVAMKYTVGVSFEGRWPRFERERKAHHTVISADVRTAMVDALAEVMDEIHDALQGAAVPTDDTYHRLPTSTHRQCSRRRAADPGEWLMREVVARAGGPMSLDHDWTTNNGRPVPAEWRVK